MVNASRLRCVVKARRAEGWGNCGEHMGRAWSPEERERACEEILAQVAKGNSLIGVCRHGDDWLPSESTFRFWCDNDQELAARYARARDLRADVIFEEILTIADSQEGDVIIVDGREVTNHDAIARAGYRPKVKSITYDRRMDEAGKAKAQDARIRRVLEMFWHRSRKCYVPHTSDALDERRCRQ